MLSFVQNNLNGHWKLPIFEKKKFDIISTTYFENWCFPSIYMARPVTRYFVLKGIIGGEGCSEGVWRGRRVGKLGHGAQTPGRDPSRTPSPSAAGRRKSGEMPGDDSERRRCGTRLFPMPVRAWGGGGEACRPRRRMSPGHRGGRVVERSPVNGGKSVEHPFRAGNSGKSSLVVPAPPRHGEARSGGESFGVRPPGVGSGMDVGRRLRGPVRLGPDERCVAFGDHPARVRRGALRRSRASDVPRLAFPAPPWGHRAGVWAGRVRCEGE